MMIYLDYAATTPICSEAMQVYEHTSTNIFGNANSLHDYGSRSNEVLEACRAELGKLFNGKKNGIFFTSGGTESNFLAIKSLIEAHRHKGNHLITTEVEHSSVLNVFRQLELEGFNVTYLTVNQHGQIDLKQLKSEITPNTILASIQHANSEIGTVQPLAKIGALLKEHHVLFHSDCIQTFGKIPIDVQKFNLDSISISSHKIYGPKGVGAVYIHPGVEWRAQYPHSTHENGFRPGTINVPGIASFVAAAQISCRNIDNDIDHFATLRQSLISELHALNRTVEVIGHPQDQLQHIVAIIIEGIEGQYTMLECNRFGIAISTGSACKVGMQEPSKTMLAIGKSKEEAKQYVRLSFGKYTTISDINKFISVLDKLDQQFQKNS